MNAMTAAAVTALPIKTVAGKRTYADISRPIFAGKILQFSGGGDALLRATRQLCRDTFETAQPQKAHRQFSREEFLRRAAQAQQTFNSEPYRTLFADWLRAIGIDTAPLYWDTLGLRIAPPVATHSGGFRSTTPVHRDTWGTGIQTQINWWAPIYPLTTGRTMAFFPDYWQQPLANTTADWSFEAYIENRRQNKKSGKAADYPSVPHATEQPATPPVPLLLPCGSITAFSAAHLHCSIANRTALTRFSFEIRTVHPHLKHQGAPNADCQSTPPLTRLFRATTNPDQRLTLN